jgi:hypothetical protein
MLIETTGTCSTVCSWDRCGRWNRAGSLYCAQCGRLLDAGGVFPDDDAPVEGERGLFDDLGNTLTWVLGLTGAGVLAASLGVWIAAALR